MVVTRGGGVMPFGTPGGDVQIQAMLQVMLNVPHFGMELQEAIEAPRVSSSAFPSFFAPFDYFPRRLAVETRIPEAPRNALAGSVEAVMSDPEAGLVRAGADPRRPAYAIAG
jgi:gamma-glutamyltranspeptidase/glutathione hydrolase